ncbi:MAG TPA: hypothetical protein VJP77_04455, partial [Planctomycetota bacterium]|nr:hypothetical protein [Planctomycetota bacterium]
ELLWRWGNPRTYGRGTADDQRLFGQHDAQWLPGERAGELRVLVFNNGGGRPDGDHSSVDELVLPFHPERGFELAEREPYGPRELAWTWRAEDPATFFAPFISGCQRLPNGNTLAVDGPQGRIVEVTPDARVVWDHWNVLGGDAEFTFGGASKDQQGADMVKPFSLFRATKIPPDHPALHGRDLTPRRR